MNRENSDIDRILDSAKNIRRAPIDPRITEKAMSEIASMKVRAFNFSGRWKAGIAASLLLLAGINLAVCLLVKTPKTSAEKAIGNEYFHYLNTSNY